MVFGRGAVEANVAENRRQQNHSLDHLFEEKVITRKEKPRREKDNEADEHGDSSEDECLDDQGLRDIERPVDVCKDPNVLIYTAMRARNVDPDNTLVKIGADDGQQIFKINVQLTKYDDCESEKDRTTYSQVFWYCLISMIY